MQLENITMGLFASSVGSHEELAGVEGVGVLSMNAHYWSIREPGLNDDKGSSSWGLVT